MNESMSATVRRLRDEVAILKEKVAALEEVKKAEALAEVADLDTWAGKNFTKVYRKGAPNGR